MVKKKNKKPELVLVEWDDAWSKDEWVDVNLAKNVSVNASVQLVGFVVKRDKTGILLSQGIAAAESYPNLFFVPKGMVKKVKTLKY